MRIGHGYDAHRFCEDKPLVIGGVRIESTYGLEAHSDGEENSEVVWMEPQEALSRDDVPELTKIMIRKAFQPGAWASVPFQSSHNPCSLYCAE